MHNYQEHNRAVLDFFEEVKKERPAEYNEVCEKYPTFSGRQWRTIREREMTAGLLGLQPEPIDPIIAAEYSIESIYGEE